MERQDLRHMSKVPLYDHDHSLIPVLKFPCYVIAVNLRLALNLVAYNAEPHVEVQYVWFLDC